MATPTPPEVLPPPTAQPRTYAELVTQINALSARDDGFTVEDIPHPAAARDLATGQAHDSLLALAAQVGQLRDRQPQRSNTQLELTALHDAIVSQTHTNAYSNTVSNFASEGVQGLSRFGTRLVDTQSNLGTMNRVLDWGVALSGAAALGYAVKKIWSSGKDLPWGIRHLWTGLKAVLITAGTLGTGWLAMRYVNARSAADEASLDDPQRRVTGGAELTNRYQTQGRIPLTDARLGLRNVDLTTVTLPFALADNRLLRFAKVGNTVMITRQTINPTTRAVTESIRSLVDDIHVDTNGEYVVRMGTKTIYVTQAVFNTAMQSAAVGAPLTLAGFSNPRSVATRTPDSVTLNWEATPPA